MKTRLWIAALAVAALVPLSAGAAFAQGGAGGGGGGAAGGGVAGGGVGGAGGGGTATATGADLQLTGSASTNSPDPGSVYSYTFLIKNSGPANATAVVLRDPIPTATVPNFATSQGSVLPCSAIGDLAGGTTYECNVGTIVKGGQATVVVNVTAPEVATAIANTASVSSEVVDPQLANNSKTVSVQVKAPTGGVCKGGICDTVPAPVAAACATITSVSAPVGYYSVWAAVWNDLTIQSCSTGTESITLEVTETNVATGSVDYSIVMPVSLLASQNVSYVLDNDFAPFSTTYLITYTVRDSSGNALSSLSTTATTPAAR